MHKIAVYTCLINDYDYLFPPLFESPNIDFVCFTDKPKLKVKGWDIRPIEQNKNIFDPTLLNRYHKFFPFKFLKDYDYSIYIDSNIRVLGDVNDLVESLEKENACLGLVKHPKNTRVDEEIQLCLKFKKIKEPDLANKQLKIYRDEGFRNNISLTENNIIIRKHQNKLIEESMELWWYHLNNYVRRDQLSLPYVRWKMNIPTLVFDWNAGTENNYLRSYYHKGSTISSKIEGFLTGRQYDSTFYRNLYPYWGGIYRRLSWLIGDKYS